jgi:3-hydroxybutyryl-CoA dehydrogenase
MGSGITEVALGSGLHVLMRDITQEAVEKGRRRIETDLERRVQERKMTSGEKETILKRFSTTTRLEDFGKCDFIIEAAIENISMKGEIFKTLDHITRKEVIPASNTSSISITRIASFTQRQDRVIGMHFFNPSPVTKLIEMVRGLVTSDETFRMTKELGLSLGKTPLEANDFPGFVSSRLIFNFMNEAIYVLYDGGGKAEEIDSIMKMGANHPMGPLELADMAKDIEAARLLLWKAPWLADQGIRNSKEAAIGKAFAADTAMRVATDAVQIYGGMGYTKWHPVEKWMRDAKVIQIYEGTARIMRLIIARHLLQESVDLGL